jgi:non-ribosomal peptide synthetase component F
MTAASDPRNIGLPISCHAWVVDPNNRHVRLPIGCTGELLIEGHIAARGYLHDEEKTAQAFVTDVAWATDRPFRGYLTGDLVFQNPDGTFNIVGRKDNQVVRSRRSLHGTSLTVSLEIPRPAHRASRDRAPSQLGSRDQA